MKKACSLLPLLLPMIFTAAAGANVIDEARSAALWYVYTLKATVGRAVREQGVVRAMEVCNSEAIRLTADLFRQSGLALKLTSLRVRNSGNEPSPAERRILEELSKAQGEGNLPEELI